MELEQKLKELEARQEWTETLLYKALGVTGPWLSPQQAAAFLSVSSEWLSREIKLAEAIRALGERAHLLYGKHYRDDQSSTSSQSTWKVNIKELAKFLELPVEQRKPSDQIMKRVTAVLSTAS